MRKHILIYITSICLVSCAWFKENLPSPYRPDIHQGNIVSQEMVDQLRPGMNKRQVGFIMGTPLLMDPFHDQRWDYIYSNEPNGQPRLQKKISLVFAQDELIGMQGDFRPGNLPSVEPSKDVSIDIPKINREKTLWESIRGIFKKGD